MHAATAFQLCIKPRKNRQKYQNRHTIAKTDTQAFVTYLTQGAEVVRNPVQKHALDGVTDGEG
jgi:hypothetical protein